MNKDKFDYFWKISLIFVLLFSMIYLGNSLKEFTLEGRDCVNQPFLFLENNSDRYGTINNYLLNKPIQKTNKYNFNLSID